MDARTALGQTANLGTCLLANLNTNFFLQWHNQINLVSYHWTELFSQCHASAWLYLERSIRGYLRRQPFFFLFQSLIIHALSLLHHHTFSLHFQFKKKNRILIVVLNILKRKADKYLRDKHLTWSLVEFFKEKGEEIGEEDRGEEGSRCNLLPYSNQIWQVVRKTLHGERKPSGLFPFNSGLCSHDYGVHMEWMWPWTSVCRCPANGINCPHWSFTNDSKMIHIK